ncbi:MAG: lipopolysaccharide biosynthesis protein [Alphaproteobacteria bacterium]
MIARSRFAPTRMTRTFAALLGGQIGARTVRIVYIVVLARLIEPSQLGLYLYGIAVYVVLLGLSGFGQNLFLAARLPHRTATQTWFSHSLTIRLGMTALAGLAGLTFLWVQESDPLVLTALTLFLGALAARSIASWVREAHVALEDAAWIPRYETGFRATEAVAGVTLALAGVGIVWLAALHFTVWTLEAAASVRLMVRRGLWPARLGRRLRLLAPMTGASFWYTVSSGLIIAYSQVSVVGLRLFDASVASIGQFAVANQGLLALLLVPSTLAAALVPALSRVRRSGAAEDQRAVTALLRWTLAAGAGLAILVEGYGIQAGTYILGERYGDAGRLFTALAWAAGPYAAAIVALQSLNALNQKRKAAAVAASMMATQAAVLATLHPWAGQDAASIATVAGALTGCVAGAILVGIALQDRRVLCWLIPLLASAGAAASMRLVPVDATILSPFVLAALIAVLVATRVFARDDLFYVLRRFGGRASRAQGRASS